MNNYKQAQRLAVLSALMIGLSGCGTFGWLVGSGDNKADEAEMAPAMVSGPAYAPTDLPPGAVALSATVSQQLNADNAADDLPITITDGNVVYRLGPTYLSALGQKCRPFQSKLDVGGGAQARSAVCSDGAGWYAVRPIALSVE